MSKMQSEACCTVPPVQVKDYKPKGKYIDIEGMKTYTTGPSTATSAIFIIFDIFGFSSQALQGADILAHADSSHQHQVFMPDFFHGKPISTSDFPPKTDAQKKLLSDFFAGPASPPKTISTITQSLLPTLRKQYPDITKYASLGMCWGGKVATLLAGKDSPFVCAAAVHPAMIDPKDAPALTVPICILASGDEDQTALKGFEEGIKIEGCHVETFADQVHGWMAARGDLEDERVRAEYERGYGVVLGWYQKYL